jgi:prepilin-type N-terminal cleavage/methylation domain-containing protein
MKTTLLRRSPASTERGLTLIELMISLTIAAVLMVGSYFGYNMIHSAKGQNTTRLLTQAGTCARMSFTSSPNFDGVTQTPLANAGCFADGNIVRADNGVANVTDSSGHEITVAAADGPGGAGTLLSFTLAGGMNRAVCTQIANGLLPSAAALTVHGEAVKTAAGEVDRANIATGCADARNTIVYSIQK